MSYVPLEKIVNENQSSLFKMVLVAAARANELVQGAQPLVKTSSKKASTVAMEEIAAGKVRCDEPKEKKKKDKNA